MSYFCQAEFAAALTAALQGAAVRAALSYNQQAAQAHDLHQHFQQQWHGTVSGLPDGDISMNNYSDAELERLTTLTGETARAGEYLKSPASNVYFRTSNHIVGCHGFEMSIMWKPQLGLRRVRSFIDRTEIDPTQDAMLKELERRRRPVISNATHAGRRVVSHNLFVSGEALVLDKGVARLFTAVKSLERVGLVMRGTGKVAWADSHELELLD